MDKHEQAMREAASKSIALSITAFTQGKRVKPDGAHGQMIGCESYRLDFTGLQLGEILEAAANLDDLIREQVRRMDETCAWTFSEIESLYFPACGQSCGVPVSKWGDYCFCGKRIEVKNEQN